MTKAPIARTFDPRWSVWSAGFGGTQTIDGNVAAGSNSVTSRIFGAAVGADYLLSPQMLAGFALGGAGTTFSVANSGSGHSDLFQAGGFFKYTAGSAYLTGALAVGAQDMTTDRTIVAVGMTQLRAQFSTGAVSSRLEGGYRFTTDLLGITPYAAGQFTTFLLSAYAEQVLSGANVFALAYGSRTVSDPRSELGVRADRSFALPGSVVTMRGRVAWAHDFNPGRGVTATFQALPGASFVVNGAAQASDSALTTLSAEIGWLNGISLAAKFDGEFAPRARAYAGTGTMRYAW
jgi:uncharacterized protein with beta-barrel porin domain